MSTCYFVSCYLSDEITIILYITGCVLVHVFGEFSGVLLYVQQKGFPQWLIVTWYSYRTTPICVLSERDPFSN